MIVHTRHALAMDIVRPVHVSVKKDGKDRIVVQWIKMHYNVYPIAPDTVHSIWIHKHAIAKQNGAVTIVQKVGKSENIAKHQTDKAFTNPHHFGDDDDDD